MDNEKIIFLNDGTKCILTPELNQVINQSSIVQKPIYSHLTDGNTLKSIISTRLTTYKHPFHRWFNLVTGFSPEFVEMCCRESHIKKNEIVLDPFSGCGTTQVACNLLGNRSVGYEPHPFIFQIGLAKTMSINISPSRLNWIKDRILYLSNNSDIVSLSPDAQKFLYKVIPKSGLHTLLRASLIQNEITEQEKPLCYVALSKVLDMVSHSRTDGIYKAPTSFKKSISFNHALESVFRDILEDIQYAQQRNIFNLATNYLQSSECMNQLPNESVSLVITSPPYPNNFDYAEMTRMYLYFWQYASNWKEITERVRSKLVINTTTSTSLVKNIQKQFRYQIPVSMLSKLDPIVTKLKYRRLEKAGRKEYYLFIYPYFAQLSSIIREVARVLKKGGLFNMIVADSALYGIHIKTEQFLADLMRFHGLSVLEIKLLRKRGSRWILKKREGTPEGLGDFHIIARKERKYV